MTTPSLGFWLVFIRHPNTAPGLDCCSWLVLLTRRAEPRLKNMLFTSSNLKVSFTKREVRISPQKITLKNFWVRLGMLLGSSNVGGNFFSLKYCYFLDSS